MARNNGPRSLNELNDYSKRSRLVVWVALGMIIASIVTFVGYQTVQNNNKAAELKKAQVDSIYNAAMDTYLRKDTINAIYNMTEPYRAFIIGSKKTTGNELIDETNGPDYRRADYFSINNSKYYIRIMSGELSSEKITTTLIQKNQIDTWIKFDKLQSTIASYNKSDKDFAHLAKQLEQLRSDNEFLHN